MIQHDDNDFMARAIEFAELGRGTVSPNPLVGAVVVKDGNIIGSGYHKKAGNDHAEVIALREAGEKARGATLYVTLEPCCHHGNTPPCTDAIILSGVTRVVAAASDPNPLVCGKGVSHLHDAGIEVIVGVLEKPAREQNEAFTKYILTKLPFVTLKLAATLDGNIAAPDGSSRWITGPSARMQVHRMRSWSDAVMVGIGTVLADDPSLTVRGTAGNNPLRVIIDSQLKTPLNSKVVSQNTLICVLDTVDTNKIEEFREHGVDFLIFPVTTDHIDLAEVMEELGKRQVTSVLCEGGAKLASALLRQQLVDKIVYMVAPKMMGNGKRVFEDIGVKTIGDVLNLRHVSCDQLGDDFVFTGYPSYISAR